MAWILSLICFATLLGVAKAMTCEDDGECSNNMYCYTATHTCVQCIQCSEYRRQDKGFCVKEPLQCGDCLDGYEHEILSDGVRTLCIQSSFPEPQFIMTSQLSWQPWVFGAFGISLTACAVFAFFKCKDIVQVKYRSSFFPETDSTSSSSSALYAPSAPTQPPSNGGSGELQMLSMENEKMIPRERYLYKENEVLQMASKYLSPNYVFNSPDDEPAPPPPNIGGGQDNVDGPGPPAVPPQEFLIDEDTLPSDWSPGPEYPSTSSTSTVPLVTSFSGILLNEARSSSDAGSGSQQSSANHSAHSSNSRENVSQINVTNITVINSGTANSAGVYNITKT